MIGKMASIAVTVIIKETKRHVVYGDSLKVAVPGVITRCLATYGNGVQTGMMKMHIQVIKLAI
jgi:hypothetical protein